MSQQQKLEPNQDIARHGYTYDTSNNHDVDNDDDDDNNLDCDKLEVAFIFFLRSESHTPHKWR